MTFHIIKEWEEMGGTTESETRTKKRQCVGTTVNKKEGEQMCTVLSQHYGYGISFYLLTP